MERGFHDCREHDRHAVFIVHVILGCAFFAATDDEIIQLLSESFSSIAIAHAPPRPSMGKWTPLLDFSAWHMFALPSDLRGQISGSTSKAASQDAKEAMGEWSGAGSGCHDFAIDVSWTSLRNNCRNHRPDHWRTFSGKFVPQLFV